MYQIARFRFTTCVECRLFVNLFLAKSSIESMTAKSTKKRKRIGSASENSQNDFAVQNVKLTTAKRSMTPMQTQSQSATKIAILKSAKKAKPKPSALAVASKPKLKARATKKIIKRKVTKDAGKEKDISSALGVRVVCTV